MKRPNLLRYVGVCGACGHWQIDGVRRALLHFGGPDALAWAMAEEHHAHIYGECPGGPDSRVLIDGEWLPPPPMSDGQLATAVIVFEPVPEWWVTK